MDFSSFVEPEEAVYIVNFLQFAEQRANYFCFDWNKRFVTLVLYKEHPKAPKEIGNDLVLWPDNYLSALDSKEAMDDFPLEWCAENVFPMSDPLWEEIKLTLEMSLL